MKCFLSCDKQKGRNREALERKLKGKGVVMFKVFKLLLVSMGTEFPLCFVAVLVGCLASCFLLHCLDGAVMEFGDSNVCFYFMLLL